MPLNVSIAVPLAFCQMRPDNGRSLADDLSEICSLSCHEGELFSRQIDAPTHVRLRESSVRECHRSRNPVIRVIETSSLAHKESKGRE